MGCKSTGANEQRYNQFNKIRLLSDIGNHIAMYGVQCGLETLMDDVDLSCGAVPEGTFEQVIDLNAPHQFLSMYTKIAEDRFAFVVSALIKSNSDFLPILVEFCARIGREMNVEIPSDSKQGFEVYNSFVLDGMPCDETKKLIVNSPEKVEWEKLVDTHAESWKKFNADISIFYQLQECFVNGLLENSGLKFENKGGEKFSIVNHN